MSNLLLNTFDSDDEDSDYVPSGDDEVDNQEVKTFSDTKVIADVDETEPQPSALEKKARVDSLWKQFLDNESDVSSQKVENNVTKATSKDDFLHQSPKLETTCFELPCEPSISKQISSFEETTSDQDLSKPGISKQTLRSSTVKDENCKSETLQASKKEGKVIIKSQNSSAKKRSIGLNSLLGKIQNKKPKVTTLQKSLSDWESFKKDEGIGSDLEIFNRGKSGYLERQAFLMRSDLRSFEVEKSVRLAKK